MAFPLIGKALSVLAPIVKSAVMDAVKDVAMDLGKKFVDTLSKGIGAGFDQLVKGTPIGDLLKNPIEMLKGMADKLIPQAFKDGLAMGKGLVQIAASIIQKLLENVGAKSNMPVVCGTGPKPASQVEGDAGAARTGSSGSSGSSGRTADATPTGSGKQLANRFKEGGLSGAQLESLQMNDPKKFQEMMRSMSTEDRGMAMQQLQMHLQSVNQMISMMTNMNQVQHDTSKAVLNNLRV